MHLLLLNMEGEKMKKYLIVLSIVLFIALIIQHYIISTIEVQKDSLKIMTEVIKIQNEQIEILSKKYIHMTKLLSKGLTQTRNSKMRVRAAKRSKRSRSAKSDG